MATTPVLIGAYATLTLQPDFPVRTRTTEGLEYLLSFRATDAVVDAAEPSIGDAVAGYADTTHSVAISRVTREPGGISRLDLTLRDNTLTQTTISLGGADAEYELDIAQVQRPIETHPRYNDTSDPQNSSAYSATTLATTCTLYTLDDDGLPTTTPSTDPHEVAVPLYAIWDAIKRLDLTSARILYLRIPTDPAGLRAIINHLWEDTAKGETEYLTFAPTGRTRDSTASRPSPVDFGVVETPPTGLGWPTGWEALRAGGTYSRRTRTGRFRRDLLHLGAKKWNPRYYYSA